MAIAITPLGLRQLLTAGQLTAAVVLVGLSRWQKMGCLLQDGHLTVNLN